jgi:hypothetical protein
LNRFHLSAKSGIIAASLGANSVLFAWRNAHASKHLFLSALTVKWRTITGYTAEQEIQIAVLPVTAFGASPANYTGGTDLSDYTGGSAVLATNAIRARSKNRGDQSLELRSSLETGNVRIATTAGLSHAGSPTIATHPWMADGCLELATSTTVQRGIIDMFWEAPTFETQAGMVDYEGCWKIPSGEGFVVTNPIALGAGGTGRLYVEADWLES